MKSERSSLTVVTERKFKIKNQLKNLQQVSVNYSLRISVKKNNRKFCGPQIFEINQPQWPHQLDLHTELQTIIVLTYVTLATIKDSLHSTSDSYIYMHLLVGFAHNFSDGISSLELCYLRRAN